MKLNAATLNETINFALICGSSSLAGPGFKNHLDAPVDMSQESDDGIGLHCRSNEVTGTDVGTDESLFDVSKVALKIRIPNAVD